MSDKRKPPSVNKSSGGIKMTISSVIHRGDPDAMSIKKAAIQVTETAIENAVRQRIVTKTLGQMLRAKLREAPMEDTTVERLRVIFHATTSPEVILANAAVDVFTNYTGAATRHIILSNEDKGKSGNFVPVVFGGGMKLAPKTIGAAREGALEYLIIGVPDYVPGNIMVIRNRSVACTHPDHITVSFSREHQAWLEKMTRGDTYLEIRMTPMDFAKVMVYLTTAY